MPENYWGTEAFVEAWPPTINADIGLQGEEQTIKEEFYSYSYYTAMKYMSVRGNQHSNQKTEFLCDSKVTQKPYLYLVGCAWDMEKKENMNSCNFWCNFQISLLII